MGLTPEVMGDDPDYEGLDQGLRQPSGGPLMSEPQLVPLNAIFATDFVQILVPVTTANTMAEVAAAVARPCRGQTRTGAALRQGG